MLDSRNRAMMRDGHLVVLLEASAETIVLRLERGALEEPRPLLASEDPLGRVRALKAAREPIYRDAAHQVVETDGLDVHAVASRVAELVESALRPRG